jgi:23S rRNA pseudouridine1911/1915/1917 synthase
VHLAFAGYPIVGDMTYGRRKQAIALDRHFLHAAGLTLRLPADEREMSFAAELPVELEAVLETLRPVA